MLGQLITFLAIVLPAWGAAVHAIANLLEHDRMAARSKKMSDVLAAAAGRAEEAATLDELRLEVALAEQLMAAENQEWLVSLSFRGLTLPA